MGVPVNSAGFDTMIKRIGNEYLCVLLFLSVPTQTEENAWSSAVMPVTTRRTGHGRTDQPKFGRE